MATNLFNPISHHTSPCRRRHSSTDSSPATATAASANNVSFFLKPSTIPLTRATTFPISSSTYSTPATDPSSTATSQNISLDLLRQHLSDQNFRQADEETRRLVIVLAGESAQKRGYVFFSEVQFIPESELKAIDELWRQYSDERFGYSVQKKIWKKVNKDFTKFFVKVAWMKKLESSEVEQFNYRAFPTEFMWDMDENTVEGHLPLTNALRGTQLLNCILNHKAFEDDDNEEEEGDEDESNGSKPLGRTFKTTYSF
ncbi:tetrapyrrole-binding protein, chloroplastic [Henckelia pumila]|uniref:tetrapyrrole-binding protein, chloroplastic n=1 Tax=Henckelia pumila TaxID=405737 RepID=UPI003C6DFC6D